MILRSDGDLIIMQIRLYFLVCLPADLDRVLDVPLPSAPADFDNFFDFEFALDPDDFCFLVQYFSSRESKNPPSCSSLDACLALIKAFRLSSPPSIEQHDV